MIDMNETNTTAAATMTIKQAERAYRRALSAESKAVAALPDKATQTQTDRCWALAAKTNQAMRTLQILRDGHSDIAAA